MRGGGAPHGPYGPQGRQRGLWGGRPGRGEPPGGVRPGGAPQPWADLCQRAKIRIRPRMFGRKTSRDLANLDPPRAPEDLPRHFSQIHRGRKLHTFDELWPIEIFPEKKWSKRPRLPMSTGTWAGVGHRVSGLTSGVWTGIGCLWDSRVSVGQSGVCGIIGFL